MNKSNLLSYDSSEADELFKLNRILASKEQEKQEIELAKEVSLEMMEELMQ
jgi:hypothetical protein